MRRRKHRNRRHSSRRGRRYNRMFRLFGRNRRRGGRGRRRSYNRRHHRKHRRHRNPSLSLSKPVGALTAGFNFNVLKRAGVMTVGALGNTMLSGLVSAKLPSVARFGGGVGDYAIGLGTAGLLSAGVGMLAPAYAGDVLLGGVFEVGVRALTPLFDRFVKPMMNGLGDYLTVQNAASARPLNGMGNMGDYLTVQNAASARPLNGLGRMGDDVFISEELAAM